MSSESETKVRSTSVGDHFRQSLKDKMDAGLLETMSSEKLEMLVNQVNASFWAMVEEKKAKMRARKEKRKRRKNKDTMEEERKEEESQRMVKRKEEAESLADAHTEFLTRVKIKEPEVVTELFVEYVRDFCIHMKDGYCYDLMRNIEARRDVLWEREGVSPFMHAFVDMLKWGAARERDGRALFCNYIAGRGYTWRGEHKPKFSCSSLFTLLGDGNEETLEGIVNRFMMEGIFKVADFGHEIDQLFMKRMDSYILKEVWKSPSFKERLYENVVLHLDGFREEGRNESRKEGHKEGREGEWKRKRSKWARKRTLRPVTPESFVGAEERWILSGVEMKDPDLFFFLVRGYYEDVCKHVKMKEDYDLFHYLYVCGVGKKKSAYFPISGAVRKVIKMEISENEGFAFEERDLSFSAWLAGTPKSIRPKERRKREPYFDSPKGLFTLKEGTWEEVDTRLGSKKRGFTKFINRYVLRLLKPETAVGARINRAMRETLSEMVFKEMWGGSEPRRIDRVLRESVTRQVKEDFCNKG